VSASVDDRLRAHLERAEISVRRHNERAAAYLALCRQVGAHPGERFTLGQVRERPHAPRGLEPEAWRAAALRAVAAGILGYAGTDPAVPADLPTYERQVWRAATLGDPGYNVAVKIAQSAAEQLPP